MIVNLYGYYSEFDYGGSTVNRNLSKFHDENGNSASISVFKNILERVDTPYILFKLEDGKFIKSYINSNMRLLEDCKDYFEEGDRVMMSIDDEDIKITKNTEERDGVPRKRVIMNFKKVEQLEKSKIEENNKINELKVEKHVYDKFLEYFKGYKLFENHNTPGTKMSLVIENRVKKPDLVCMSNDEEEFHVVEIKYNSKNDYNIAGQIVAYAKAARLKYPDKKIRVTLLINKESLSLKSMCSEIELHPRVSFSYRIYKHIPYVPAHLDIGVL